MRKTPEEIKKPYAGPALSVNEVHDFIKAVCDELEITKIERDALMADLTLACGDTPNPCLVCGHYRTEPKPDCEMNGFTCAWYWRGIAHRKGETNATAEED